MQKLRLLFLHANIQEISAAAAGLQISSTYGRNWQVQRVHATQGASGVKCTHGENVMGDRLCLFQHPDPGPAGVRSPTSWSKVDASATSAASVKVFVVPP